MTNVEYEHSVISKIGFPFKPNGIPSVIDWSSPVPFLGLLGGIFHFYSNFDRTFCKQTLETDMGLITIFNVCLCTTKRTLGLYLLKANIDYTIQNKVHNLNQSIRHIAALGKHELFEEYWRGIHWRYDRKQYVPVIEIILSYFVASGIDITLCNKIDKPLAVYRLSNVT